MSKYSISTFTNAEKLLTKYAQDWANPTYISDQIVCKVPVDQESGHYWSFSKDKYFVSETLIADKALATTADTNYFKKTYTVNAYGLNESYSKRELAATAGSGINIETDKLDMIMHRLKNEEELRLRNLMVNSGCPGSGALSADKKWSNYTSATSTPLEDIEAGIRSVFSGCLNIAPTHLVIPYTVASYLKNHPDILNTRLYGQTSMDQLLATAGLPPVLSGLKVIIANTSVTAMPDNSTVHDTLTASELWSDDVWVLRVQTSPTMHANHALTKFVLQDYYTKKWYEQPSECFYIETRNMHEFYIGNVNAMYRIQDVL